MINIGQITTGKITGIQPYGAFVLLEEDWTGLIHISEISDGFVKDVENFIHIADVVQVKVLDIDKKNHQCRLSLKACQNRSRRSDKRKKIDYLPEMKLGFKSIQDTMDQWIEKAKKGDNI